MSVKTNILKLYSSIPPKYLHLFDDYHRVYKFYQDAQWWPRERIEAWQLERLQYIVKLAYDNTEGYRQLYDETHVKPSDIQKLEDIQLLPFTDKELIRNNVNAFTNSKVKGRLSNCATSGSTGTPFIFHDTRKTAAVEYSFMDSLWESAGWKANDVGLRIRGGLESEVNQITCKKLSYHRYAISSQYLNDDNYEAIKEYIWRYHVSFLHVYPSTIAELSQLVIQHGDIDKLPIQRIFVGSEKYYTWQYDLTKKAFPNAKIVHWYGHSERAVWAPWCEKTQMFHINPFYGFAEVLTPTGTTTPGDSGELVGTSFWMYATMFIRYKTGDRVTTTEFDSCEQCGRNFKILSSIEGRKQDVVVGKSGRRMSLTIFDGWAMHGDFFANIKVFRFIQKEQGKLTLLIVPKPTLGEDEYDRFKQKIRNFFSVDYEIEFIIVDEIKRSKSGKFTYLEQYMEL